MLFLVYCAFMCSGGTSSCDADSEFMCVSDRKCIHALLHCDGMPHCHDGSDELNCRGPGEEDLMLHCLN